MAEAVRGWQRQSEGDWRRLAKERLAAVSRGRQMLARGAKRWQGLAKVTREWQKLTEASGSLP